MKNNILLGLGLLALSSVAFGQSVTIGTDSISTGTATATVEATYTAGGNGAAGLAFNVTYNAANFTFGSCTGPTACDGTTAGTVTVGFISGGAIADGATIATIVLNSATAAANTYPVAAAAGATFTDAVTFVDMPLTVNAGSITVSAGPGPGNINMPAAVSAPISEVNGAASSVAIQIDNTGTVANGDAALTGSCALGAVTGTAGVVITAPALTLTAAAGASQTVTAMCSGTAVGTATADYVCTPTAPTTATNATTTVNCEVGMGVPVPAAPPAISLRGVEGTTVNGSGVFSNTADNGSSYALACTASAGFTIVSGVPATVDFATPATVIVSAVIPAAGMPLNGTLDCTADGNALPPVGLSASVPPAEPEVIPTLSQWALILMALALAGYAGLALRRREGFEA